MSVPLMVVLGAGGHAKSIVDSIETSKAYEVRGFISPDSSAPYRDIDIIGSDDDLPAVFCAGVTHAAVGIGLMAYGGKTRRIAIEAALSAGCRSGYCYWYL